MITKESFDNVDALMREAKEATDKLLQVANIAKNLYENEQDEYFKKIYKALNNAYCNAGNIIAVTNLSVTTANMDLLMKIIQEEKDE